MSVIRNGGMDDWAVKKGLEAIEQYKHTKASDASTTSIKSVAMVERCADLVVTRKTYLYGNPAEAPVEAIKVQDIRNDTGVSRAVKVSAKA